MAFPASAERNCHDGSGSSPKIRTLPIADIRRDGETQARVALDSRLINEYAMLMAAGVNFPPVRVWFDGNTYWLADGFHRLSAALQAGVAEFAAEVRLGSLADARWDSYGANAGHGMRRGRADTELTIQRALKHPKASPLSNVQIAKHLGIPEATLRRWRKRLSSSSDEDGIRVASRGGTTYPMKVGNIGKSADRRNSARKSKSMKALREDLVEMRANASSQARRVLTVVYHLTLGTATWHDCLDALEKICVSSNCELHGRK